MRAGDLVLYYHSVVGKQVVGIATVTRETYPDPTASEGSWECIDLAPFKALNQPVSLEMIKANALLAGIPLVRQSRLSVIPLSALEYDEILRLGA
ncbi:MAG: ubiquinol-cytochrome reductase [Chthoniobacteraceae bacterium]|nr:ubiquinol-cytochrome reductase [Chthoniobacteraceae bacterium]